jgi:hypothetical protein
VRHVRVCAAARRARAHRALHQLDDDSGISSRRAVAMSPTRKSVQPASTRATAGSASTHPTRSRRAGDRPTNQIRRTPSSPRADGSTNA